MIGLMRNPVRGPDAHRLLLRDLLARLPDAALLSSRSEPWASVTFSGTRHVVALDLRDRTAANGFAAAASEIEFALRGHIVIDIVVRADDGRLAIEALTVEDL